MNAHALGILLARRLAVRSVLRGAVRGWLAGCLLAGGLLLLLRHGLRLPFENWRTVCLLPSFLAVAGAVHAWRRYRFSSSAAAALLDARGGYGGLLVAADLPGWEAWKPVCRFPDTLTVQWHEPRVWCLAALASLFAVMAAVWPQRPPAAVLRRMQIDSGIDRLQEQVAVLADSLLDDDSAQALIDQLEHLRQTARSDAPVDAWETLDQIADRLRMQSAEAAEKALNAMRQLGPLATVAEALRDMLAQTPFSDELDQWLAQLAHALEASAHSTEWFPADALADALRTSFPDGAFDAAALEGMSAQWRTEWDHHRATLSEWSEARLIDAAMLQFCTNGMDRAAAEAALAMCFSCETGGDNGEAIDGLLAGLFGISRGPGPAPLIIGDPVEILDTDGVALHPTSMPLMDPGQMRSRGTSAIAPETEPAAPTSAGRLDGTVVGGGSAHRQSLLPRHRHVAAAYFGAPVEDGRPPP